MVSCHSIASFCLYFYAIILGGILSISEYPPKYIVVVYVFTALTGRLQFTYH